MKIVEPALHNLMAGFCSGRIYHQRAPQNATAPYIIFQKLDGVKWRSINGPSGVKQGVYQIDCYARVSYDAKQLSGDVEELLDGFVGVVEYGADSPQESVRIAGISYQNDVDIIDETDAPLLFRDSATFLVTFHTGD